MKDGNTSAFGAPGIEPRWTSSAKEGLGTAYNTSCQLWFTLSHGIVNEIYFPSVDQPNTRDFEFLITDGESFFHEEKRDLVHKMQFPEKNCPYYRLVNSDPAGRYRLTKDILTDPYRPVLLVHARLEILDTALQGKLRVYALLAPHISRFGEGNSGWCMHCSNVPVLYASREQVHLVMGCTDGFSKRSVGFVGFSDGWQDLQNYQMDWEFCSAENGNIALTAEITPNHLHDFTVGVSLGHSYHSASTQLLQSLADPIDLHINNYVKQWRRALVRPDFDFHEDTGDEGHLYRMSRCILLAHEDKIFQGAMVASMSIPWGETKGDNDLGGYHLVWTRDLVQSASALLATGQQSTPLRALIWLAAIQHEDGGFPQNSWIDGTAYWPGTQLDEIAAPMLLAWRLHCEKVSFGLFNPVPMLLRAAANLILQGPVTGQERWEENAGYSPSTLAVVIAGLVCAAQFVHEQEHDGARDYILAYADWLAAHIEDWTVTTRGELLPGVPRHYIRITPTDALHADPHPDPDTALLMINNGGGQHPARNIIGGDFLHLVRLGIRHPHDPLVVDSLKVVDHVLRRELPQGHCWRRYNHDGYGQKENGDAYDGTGTGRSWPLLTGERGHYELSAGRDPLPYIRAIEKFANCGALLTEQLWDAPDLPEKHLRFGHPSGAAMPLCWSHAEYVSLVRSRHDGVVFDRVQPAYERYVLKQNHSKYEFWSLRHRLEKMPKGKTLRLIMDAPASVQWKTANGSGEEDLKVQEKLKLWYADLPTNELKIGESVQITINNETQEVKIT